MRPDRTGFTAVELLVVMLIGAILTSMGVSQFSRYEARQGARNARDSFVYMAGRARSIAIERGAAVRLVIDPAQDRTWIQTGQTGVGQTLEELSYKGEFAADVTTSARGPVTVCYAPRGFALRSCSMPQSTQAITVTFARGTHVYNARVRPLGQVDRQ